MRMLLWTQCWSWLQRPTPGRKKLDWNQDVLTLPSSPARMFLKNSQRTVYYWAPIYNIENLREDIQRISAIGRSSFLREIGGERIPRPEVKEILQHLDDGSKTMLLEGGPGAGKSCVLLNLVDQLEQDPDAPYQVIYLQTKEFDGIGNGTDRISQELDHDLPRKIARFAECHPVVVAMDSLDVIAISTGRRCLQILFCPD